MTERLTIDKAGRIVLPKPLRDRLKLTAGDSLQMEASGDEILLRPLRGTAPLRKKRGVWVFRAEEPLTHAEVEGVRTEIREEREATASGQTKTE